jgi:alpha-beta hydrolase superfamily lysophospholipase
VPNAVADVNHREGRVRSADGTELFEQSWAPSEPRAVICLVHGYAEHSGRYDSTALFLAQAGFAVQALDLRGHGRSAGRRCFVSDFHDYLSDVDAVLQRAARSWPDRRTFLMGHSLGGLISVYFAIESGEGLSGLVLSAPSVRLGSDFSPLKARIAELLGRALPNFPTVRFRSESLSRDASVVQGYRADRMVYQGRTPARTASEIIRAIRAVQERVHCIELPLLVMHGSEDQVADIEGSRRLHDCVGSEDKTLGIYDGLYHEIMNEPEKASVLGDVSAWLSARTRAE